ncbi:MAG: hypothetical protein ABI640_16455 [Gammaproteobacteria bacterium]
MPGRTAQVFDLPNVLSKFLLLGMPLDDVIARVTRRAAWEQPPRHACRGVWRQARRLESG